MNATIIYFLGKGWHKDKSNTESFYIKCLYIINAIS